MVSDQQLSANRKNAHLSSGPRTLAGKLRSRSNALRHGLATPIGGRLDIAQAIDGLAKQLCGSSNSFSRNQNARAVAECHFELQRIRSARAEVLRRIGELESADAGEHDRAAVALDKIARYERRVRSRQRKALRELAPSDKL
jgi:hypothetical protein